MNTLCTNASLWMVTLLLAAGCAGDTDDIPRHDAATVAASSASKGPDAVLPATGNSDLGDPAIKTTPPFTEPCSDPPELADGSDIVLTRVLEQLEELRQSRLKAVQSDTGSGQ